MSELTQIKAKDTSIRYPEPVLCYVDGEYYAMRAWFTTLPLDIMGKLCNWHETYDREEGSLPNTYEDYLEWYEFGIDVNDEDATKDKLEPFATVSVLINAPLWNGFLEGFRVNDINGGVVAWLSSNYLGEYNPIFAQTPITEFMKRIEGMGGTLFLTPQQHEKYYPAVKKLGG